MTISLSKSDNLATLFLLLASTMTVMAGATLAPALPGMKAAFSSLPHAEFWVKMALSAPGLVIAICAPLVGMLLDHGHKKVLLTGALLWYGASGFAGYLFQDSIIAILISRIALGVAVAGVMVSCTTLAGDYFKGPKLGQYMGLQAAFGGFGGVAFLSVAGVLAEQHWSNVFFVYLLALAVFPGVMAFLTEPKQGASKSEDYNGPSAAGNSLYICYALAALEVVVLYSLTLQLPFLLQGLNIGGSSDSGFILALLLLAMSLVSLGYGWISRYFSIAMLHLGGWTLISVGLLGLSQSQIIEAILPALLLVGIGLGLIRPNLIVWLFSFTPLAMRGKVIGGITTCFFLGQFISAIITEPLVQTYGYSMLFFLMAVIGLVVVGCVALYKLVQATSQRAART